MIPGTTLTWRAAGLLGMGLLGPVFAKGEAPPASQISTASQISPVESAALARADRALRNPPPTVMEKPLMPADWDPHDYSSPARYYWPDPSKTDGLPWIVKDGFPNQDAISRSDSPRLSRLIGDVEALVTAWKVRGDVRYAEGAARDLRAWFLDPATRMNPHFRGAQFVAGKDRGRGGGLIDMAQLWRLLDAATALEAWPGWLDAERKGLRTWMGDFLTWMDQDKGAAKEAKAANNHGTWFAVTRASLLVYLGRKAEAKVWIEQCAARLAPLQFAPDGQQPLEASRADGISYSRYNLEAWRCLADFATRVGAQVDLSGPQKAAAFLAPYLADPSSWPGSQKNPLPKGREVPLGPAKP